MRKTPKAKIIDRVMMCTVECPFCEEEMIYDSTETYLITEGVDLTCPYCNRKSAVETVDYLSQYN